MLENQMLLTSLEPSRQKLVLSVIEEYHGPIVSVSFCPMAYILCLKYHKNPLFTRTLLKARSLVYAELRRGESTHRPWICYRMILV